MSQTEAQIRASKKYRQKFVHLQARVTEEEKEKVVAHAKSKNESLNDFMRRAFAETITRDQAADKSGNE